MTLCIAAKTSGSIEGPFSAIHLDPAIVLCSDRLGLTTSSGAETFTKLADLGHGFMALLAGDSLSVAHEIAGIIASCFKEQPPTSDDNHNVQVLRKALGIHKRQIADSLTQAQLGMSYQEFQRKGKATLPEDLHRDLYWEIKNRHSGAELLVAGFVKVELNEDGLYDHAVIYKLSGDEVWVCDYFGAIGSGAEIGESSLFYREHTSAHSLDRTIYHVYEAKRLGEKAPGVGKKTIMGIARPYPAFHPRISIAKIVRVISEVNNLTTHMVIALRDAGEISQSDTSAIQDYSVRVAQATTSIMQVLMSTESWDAQKATIVKLLAEAIPRFNVEPKAAQAVEGLIKLIRHLNLEMMSSKEEQSHLEFFLPSAFDGLAKQFEKFGPQPIVELDPMPPGQRIRVPTGLLPKSTKHDQSGPPPSRGLPEGSNES